MVKEAPGKKDCYSRGGTPESTPTAPGLLQWLRQRADSDPTGESNAYIDPAVTELRNIADQAQAHRLANVWAKFFNAKLVPHASRGFTAVEVESNVIGTFFSPKRQDDVESLARSKAVQCVKLGSRRSGAKGKGKGSIHTYRFSWADILLSDGAILHEAYTGVHLLKETASGRMRLWARFFKAELKPAAEHGFNKVSWDQDQVDGDFPFVDRNDITSAVPALTAMAARMGVNVDHATQPKFTMSIDTSSGSFIVNHVESTLHRIVFSW